MSEEKIISIRNIKECVNIDMKEIYIDALTINLNSVSIEDKQLIKDTLNYFDIEELRQLYLDGLNFGMDRIHRMLLKNIKKCIGE